MRFVSFLCLVWLASHAPGVVAGSTLASVHPLLERFNCLTCHAVDHKLVGPAYTAIARRHATRPDAVAYLARKIREGSAGLWGPGSMPPNWDVDAASSAALAEWIASGAAAK